MAGSGTAHLRPAGEALLRVEGLSVEFPAGRGRTVKAVSNISFDVVEGETLGLVGESGCGKSTTGKAIIRLNPVTTGTIDFAGRDIAKLKGEALRKVRPELQMIFQDPISSINPRRTIGDVVGEPLKVWGKPNENGDVVRRVLDDVGLAADVAMPKRRHEFSGGQCQRICIARALVLEPRMIICDEPVSALDVSVQAQILNILEDMKARYGLTLVFIAHDLAVVKNISDRVAVMYLGKMCEVAPPALMYNRPAHPYTATLLSAIPVPDPLVKPTQHELAGELPSPINPPSGCRFRTRCSRVQERCSVEEPQMREVETGQFVACHYPLIGEEAPATPVSVS